MKKFVAIALVALAAVLLFHVSRPALSGIDGHVDPAIDRGQKNSSPAVEARDGLAKRSARVNGARGRDPFPLLARDRRTLSLADDFFGPQSRAEQAWLDRNGYPTRDQVDTYSNASDAQLEQAAKLGDKTAEVFLNQRHLMQGDASAESKLIDQAARGTTYALLGMAGYYAGSTSNADPMKAYAYTRAIEMLGDQKMGLTRDFILRGQLDPPEKFAAEAQSIATYNEILKRRRALLGPNAPVVDPRPVVQHGG